MSLLAVEAVSVSFGGLKALDGVSLEAPLGQVTGLIGPNGAGKTTLFDVVTGLRRPTRGRITLDGTDITRRGPRARARMGVGRTFQRLELFSSLSVVDNVLVALENNGRGGRSARREAGELLEKLSLTEMAASPAAVLPTGSGRLLELARALACRPRLLLLDEPFSGLDGPESARLAAVVEGLAGEGLALLLVEHDMEMVMRLCAHICVLSFGRLIAGGPPAEIQADPAVREAYLGVAAAS